MNSNKFNDRTKAWLDKEFDAWQKFDLQTQKWKTINVVGGNFKGLMNRFIENFPDVKDQLTEKQIRSYLSRLRAKIKSRINEARSQDIINEKVRNEVIKELQKIKERMTGSKEIESEESLQPPVTTGRRPVRR